MPSRFRVHLEVPPVPLRPTWLHAAVCDQVDDAVGDESLSPHSSPTSPANPGGAKDRAGWALRPLTIEDDDTFFEIGIVDDRLQSRIDRALTQWMREGIRLGNESDGFVVAHVVDAVRLQRFAWSELEQLQPVRTVTFHARTPILRNFEVRASDILTSARSLSNDYGNRCVQLDLRTGGGASAEFIGMVSRLLIRPHHAIQGRFTICLKSQHEADFKAFAGLCQVACVGNVGARTKEGFGSLEIVSSSAAE